MSVYGVDIARREQGYQSDDEQDDDEQEELCVYLPESQHFALVEPFYTVRGIFIERIILAKKLFCRRHFPALSFCFFALCVLCFSFCLRHPDPPFVCVCFLKCVAAEIHQRDRRSSADSVDYRKHCDYLLLAPAAHLEMMMNGSHLEDALAVSYLEIAYLEHV